jgi:hypothetical protein
MEITSVLLVDDRDRGIARRGQLAVVNRLLVLAALGRRAAASRWRGEEPTLSLGVP